MFYIQILFVCNLLNIYTIEGFSNIRYHQSIKKFKLYNVRQPLINPIKQLQLKFSCDEVDADEISELLLEVGTLSVSVEVDTMRPETIEDKSKWSDLQKQKNWATALLRANFPQSYEENELKKLIIESFPNVNFQFNLVDVENKDWVTHVQSSWSPQIIGDLTIKFPWHTEISSTPQTLGLFYYIYIYIYYFVNLKFFLITNIF